MDNAIKSFKDVNEYHIRLGPDTRALMLIKVAADCVLDTSMAENKLSQNIFKDKKNKGGRGK